jgi:sterol 14-demethylase
MLVRVAQQDFVYKDWFVPRGTWILISPTVSHEIPELFADPLRFDPDRFAPGREEDKRDFAYVPFGGGRHKCLGNAFALLQVKAILAILLGRFEFELAGDPIAADFHGLVVGPKDPCRVRYRKRARPSVGARGSHAAAPATNGASVHASSNGAAAGGCPFHAGDGAEAATAPRAMRLVVDRDLCQGHAVCVGEAPELFRIGDDGKTTLLVERPPAELHAKAAAAARYCPTRAIRVVEE